MNFIQGLKQWFSNFNVHQNYLEGLFKDPLSGSTHQGFCFNRLWMGAENLHV